MTQEQDTAMYDQPDNDYPHCEMRDDCEYPVTHIGNKGYIYCDKHASQRRGYESSRALRNWEIALLEQGKQVPSYKPISKREATARGLL